MTARVSSSHINTVLNQGSDGQSSRIMRKYITFEENSLIPITYNLRKNWCIRRGFFDEAMHFRKCIFTYAIIWALSVLKFVQLVLKSFLTSGFLGRAGADIGRFRGELVVPVLFSWGFTGGFSWGFKGGTRDFLRNL